LFHFPFENEFNDCESFFNYEQQSVKIQEKSLIFQKSNYSFLFYKPYFLYGMKKTTLNFFIKFPSIQEIVNDFNGDFSGTVISKTKSVFNLFVSYYQ
jgi:hypothetical protein